MGVKCLQGLGEAPVLLEHASTTAPHSWSSFP